MVIPFNTFRAFFKGRRSIDIGVQVIDPEKMDEAEDQLVGILRRARQTPPEKADDFAINKPEQLASTYQQLTGALYGVALGIGFITLLVGGIGIMNIMLVSVRERTREIGVRRALGARKRTIITQFMLEATLVSAVGGALGTLVGLGGRQGGEPDHPAGGHREAGHGGVRRRLRRAGGPGVRHLAGGPRRQPRPGGGAARRMIRAFFDNLRLAFGTFVAHPLRTLLDAAGHRDRRGHGDDDDGAARGPAAQGEQGPLPARRQRVPGRQVAPGVPLRRRGHRLESHLEAPA